MTAKETKVTTEYSEKSALLNKEFGSIAEFDILVIGLYANDKLEARSCYDKTEVVVHFDNGGVYALRFDAQRGATLSGHIKDTMCYFQRADKPDHYTLDRWAIAKREHYDFFAAHSF